MERKTILHLIYNLGRGGAETMLVQVLKELKEFRNIVVTLEKTNHFQSELLADEFICLNKPSLLSIPVASIKLNSIIKNYKIDLVHSHLPQSNFIARLATPDNIPLISTIHNSIAHSKDYKWAYLRWIDKFTFNFRASTIIAVSQSVLDDYISILKLKRAQTVLLYNFVDEKKYENITKKNVDKEVFKIASVGSLSFQKNFIFLVKSFQFLKKHNIELHIYGQGDYYQSLNKLIEETQVNVILKGQVNNINELLPHYDLFVMSSFFEGFSLSVLEAMAARVPLLLSNIASFKEQAGETALYFNLDDPHSFANVLLSLKENPKKLTEIANKANEKVLKNFTIKHHMQQLKQIYNNEFQRY